MTDDRDRDRELIAKVAEGDRDAFSELMASTEDMVFAVCLRVMGDREAARRSYRGVLALSFAPPEAVTAAQEGLESAFTWGNNNGHSAPGGQEQ